MMYSLIVISHKAVNSGGVPASACIKHCPVLIWLLKNGSGEHKTHLIFFVFVPHGRTPS